MKLKELGTIVTGNTPSKQSVENWNSPDICFVKPDIISDTGISIIDDAAEYISEKARAKARIVGENSILITCIGSIGKIGITAKGTFAFNQQINAIIPNRKVNSKYLAYALLYAKPRLVAIANAPVVPIINKSQFGDFEIKVTENTEDQSKAVEVLDTVNAIIENRRQQLQKLDELVKARFVELFGDPLHNTKDLQTSPMTNICRIIDGDRGKNYPKQEDFSDCGFCLFLNAKNVTAQGFSFENCMYITEEKDALLHNGKLCRGDVVLTTRGTIGNLAFYDTSVPYGNVRINSGMVILRMNRNLVSEIFFMEQFKMQLDSIKSRIASGSAQPQLPISTMNKIKMILPQIELQKQFEQFVKQVDKSKVAVQKSLDEAQHLFDCLMQEYFS